MDKETLEKGYKLNIQIHNLDKEIKAMEKAVGELQYLIDQAESNDFREEVRIVYGDGRGININAAKIIGTLRQIGHDLVTEREQLAEEFKNL